MNDFKQDMTRVQELIGAAYSRTGSLVALANGGQLSPAKLQRTLEETAAFFERATLEVRPLCERYAPNVGGYGRRPRLPAQEVIGRVERIEGTWLHVELSTLLPHCRYQPPLWLTDTLRRLLDDYEAAGSPLPFYRRALLVIDEHTDAVGRQVFDADNKGWKAVSNAIKGRVIADDDQHTLSVALLSTPSDRPACHITILEQEDAALFFEKRGNGGGF